MNSSKAFRIAVLVAAGATLAGCSSSPMSRIDANRAEYESWPLAVQEAVLAGRAEKGMTPRQVEVAMGKPSEVYNRPTREGDEEVWTYREGSGMPNLGGVSVGMGTSIGGVGVSGVKSVGGQNAGYTPQHQVVFRNGEVVSVDGM